MKKKLVQSLLVSTLLLTSVGCTETYHDTAFLKVNHAYIQTNGKSHPIDSDLGLFVRQGNTPYNDCQCSNNIKVTLEHSNYRMENDFLIYDNYPGLVYAYAPYNETVTDLERIPVYMNDQLNFFYQTSSLMVHEYENCLNLNLKTLCCNIQVNIEGITCTDFSLSPIVTKGTFNLLKAELQPSLKTEEARAKEGHLLVLPLSYSNLTLRVKTKDGEKTYSIPTISFPKGQKLILMINNNKIERTCSEQ